MKDQIANEFKLKKPSSSYSG